MFCGGLWGDSVVVCLCVFGVVFVVVLLINFVLMMD